jgi:hypothetical protein
MTDTASWLWQGKGTWPGFSAGANNVIGHAGDGLTIDPGTYTEAVWNDANEDGIIADSDSEGRRSMAGETVTVDGVVRDVLEVGRFTGGSMEYNGQTVEVPMIVWVFEDGTFAVRINDSDIPPGVHHSAVTNLQLGSWDGTEYDGSYVSLRDEPFLCFAAGTLIDTPDGQRPVETLVAGDPVLTVDNGPRPLRWVGSRRIAGTGRMAPVLFRAGAIGNTRDLRLSPQHRVLVTGWQAELLFGQVEVLAPAVALVNGETIRRAPVDAVTYVHLLFDRHELIWSEGAATESFHPGACGMKMLDDAQRHEVLSLFPELSVEGSGPAAARPCLRPGEARLMRAG